MDTNLDYEAMVYDEKMFFAEWVMEKFDIRIKPGTEEFEHYWRLCKERCYEEAMQGGK